MKHNTDKPRRPLPGARRLLAISCPKNEAALISAAAEARKHAMGLPSPHGNRYWLARVSELAAAYGVAEAYVIELAVRGRARS